MVFPQRLFIFVVKRLLTGGTKDCSLSNNVLIVIPHHLAGGITYALHSLVITAYAVTLDII